MFLVSHIMSTKTTWVSPSHISLHSSRTREQVLKEVAIITNLPTLSAAGFKRESLSVRERYHDVTYATLGV